MKLKFILALALSLSGFAALAQEQANVNWRHEVADFQKELNEEFADPARSPLPKAALKKFEGLAFFPVDSSYRLEAEFIRTPNQLPFEMPTTTGRQAVYEKYGEIHFKLQGKPFVLNVYQSHTFRAREGYHDYLFLPFTDASNGNSSYGGGRYLDLRIPAGNTIILDFNKAYNPFCAYSPVYSCPIPPKANRLTIEILAGVKAP